jgi:hypothetical protein
MVLPPPTRSKVFSWRILSNFDCRARGISPTSSRKIVPLSASSKRPLSHGHSSGESSFFMAKKFTFQKIVRQRCAINRYERLGFARAVHMYRLSHEFFAGAAFTGYQYGCMGRGKPFQSTGKPEAFSGFSRPSTKTALSPYFIS